MVILAKTKIKDGIEKHPELKDVLIQLSPRFKKLVEFQKVDILSA